MKGWKFWFGLAVGLLALAYFSRDLEVSEFAQSWRRIHPFRYVEGVSWFCFSFWLRCPRWEVLTRGLGDIGLSLLTKAFFVGMLVNRLFPARLGEVARCVILKRGRMVSLWGLFATVAAEKAFDGLALLSCALLGLLFIPAGGLPSGVDEFIDENRAGILVSAFGLPLLLLLVAWSIPLVQRLFQRFHAAAWHAPFSRTLQSVLEGLEVARRGRSLLAATLLTALVWATLARSAYCAILSFGWDLHPSSGVVLCAAIGLAVIVPQAPSFVGVYQVAVQWTMVGLYGVPLQEAKAFAVAIWFMQIVPVGLIGFVCLRLLGTTLKEATLTEPSPEPPTASP